MRVVGIAVGAAVVSLVSAQQLSVMTPAQRVALWSGAESWVARTVPRPSPAGSGAVPRPATAVTAAEPPPLPGSDIDAEIIAPDSGGQFETAVEIDGRRLRTLVDTGATFVVLSYEDAALIGIHPAPSDFKYVSSTANGRAGNAKVTLPSVRLGHIALRDVTAFVSERGAMSGSLLGMSFLSRLSSVRMDRGRLLLAP